MTLQINDQVHSEPVVAALEPGMSLVIDGKELTLERFEQQIDG